MSLFPKMEYPFKYEWEYTSEIFTHTLIWIFQCMLATIIGTPKNS